MELKTIHKDVPRRQKDDVGEAKKVQLIFLHIWWTCRGLNNFWMQVNCKLHEIIGIKISKTPRTMSLLNFEGVKGAKEELTATIFIDSPKMKICRSSYFKGMDCKG